jgi:hypothetical protein
VLGHHCGHFFEQGKKFDITQVIDFVISPGLGPSFHNFQFLGDGHSRDGMVAGDHNHPDTRLPAAGHGLDGFGFQILVAQFLLVRGDLFVGQGKDAQTLTGKIVGHLG